MGCPPSGMAAPGVTIPGVPVHRAGGRGGQVAGQPPGSRTCSPVLLALRVCWAALPGLRVGSWVVWGFPGSPGPFSSPRSALPDFWARFCCSSCRGEHL